MVTNWLIRILHGGTTTVESIVIAHNCEIYYLPTFFKEFIQILVNMQWKVLALQWVNMERKYTWAVSYMILSKWFTWGDLYFFIEICMNALFELAWACRTRLYRVSVFSIRKCCTVHSQRENKSKYMCTVLFRTFLLSL